ncbi:hypothetical protein [Alkalihalobacterium alkalinitrilicum]|nr:hypothetical protein [Alkalihalobacterium alkalinitrilicum]
MSNIIRMLYNLAGWSMEQSFLILHRHVVTHQATKRYEKRKR